MATYGNRVLRLDSVYDIAYYSAEANRMHIRENSGNYLYDKYGHIGKARPVWNRME